MRLLSCEIGFIQENQEGYPQSYGFSYILQQSLIIPFRCDLFVPTRHLCAQDSTKDDDEVESQCGFSRALFTIISFTKYPVYSLIEKVIEVLKECQYIHPIGCLCQTNMKNFHQSTLHF